MRGKRRTLAIAGGLLAGFGAFVYSEYSRDIRAARARLSSGSNILNTACGPIECAEAGNGPRSLSSTAPEAASIRASNSHNLSFYWLPGDRGIAFWLSAHTHAGGGIARSAGRCTRLSARGPEHRACGGHWWFCGRAFGHVALLASPRKVLGTGAAFSHGVRAESRTGKAFGSLLFRDQGYLALRLPVLDCYEDCS